MSGGEGAASGSAQTREPDALPAEPGAPEIEPHLFLIFGATGDLAARKLVPALYHLMQRGLFAEKATVLGVSRRVQDDAAFRAAAREALAEAGYDGEALAAWCDRCLHYQSLGAGGSEDWAALRARVEALEAQGRTAGNRIFYLALPPSAFAPTVEGLDGSGLSRASGWARLVVEKPFGQDLASARALNRLLHEHFDESQIYRIDHYLGKQTVQNLLVFRFANALFESVWNRDRIECVEITVAESLGVEGRGAYYDRAGALRDMVQNHMTQLLSLVAMEPPSAFHADAIRREKLKLLESLAPIGPEDVVLGQYGPGAPEGRALPGYLQEPGVAPGSRTDTYAALRLRVESWRWQGVPFVLRTGKRLPRRSTRIAVRFRAAPITLFPDAVPGETVMPNLLLITLQPDEGFDLRFEVKAPTERFALTSQQLRYRYGDAFGPLPDAYETLLVDVAAGDQTLFVHAEEAEMSWRLYGAILADPPAPRSYAAGSWGPTEPRRWLPEARWESG